MTDTKLLEATITNLRRVLTWLDNAGGLGLERHGVIRGALGSTQDRDRGRIETEQELLARIRAEATAEPLPKGIPCEECGAVHASDAPHRPPPPRTRAPLPESWSYSEQRQEFEWTRSNPGEPLYSLCLSAVFLRRLLAHTDPSPAPAPTLSAAERAVLEAVERVYEGREGLPTNQPAWRGVVAAERARRAAERESKP